jgi:hypothetical protein
MEQSEKCRLQDAVLDKKVLPYSNIFADLLTKRKYFC